MTEREAFEQWSKQYDYAVNSPYSIWQAACQWQRAALQQATQEPDAILTGLKEAVDAAKEDGMWRPCSGCYETEDGHAVGRYSFSDALGCSLGSGCRECGGLGAIWEDFSGYEDLTEGETETPKAEENFDAMAFVNEYIEAWHEGLAGDSYLLRLAENVKAHTATPQAEAQQEGAGEQAS